MGLNETLQQLLFQIQLRNLVFQSHSYATPTPGFQNTTATSLNTGSASLIAAQQMELLNSYLQLMQSAAPFDNVTGVRESLSSLHPLLLNTTSTETQQRLPLSFSVVNVNNNGNNLNQPHRPNHSGIYRNNAGGENTLSLPQPVEMLRRTEPQNTTALPLFQDRSTGTATGHTYQPLIPADNGSNSRHDYSILQQYLATILPMGALQHSATTLPMVESSSVGNPEFNQTYESLTSTIYETNVGNDNINMYFNNLQARATIAFPSRISSNNIQNQRSFISSPLQARREDLPEIFPTFSDGANTILSSTDVDSAEHSEAPKNDVSGLVTPRKKEDWEKNKYDT
jgi:hypothetical protein